MNTVLVNQLTEIAVDIFNNVGPGYNEVIYHNAFEVGLRLKGVRYQSEVIVPVFYNAHNIGHGRIDLLIDNSLIIELKAIGNFNGDTANIQIKNYMKQYSIKDGLVINFGQPNKASTGELNVRYIFKESETLPIRTFNYTNGTFLENNQMVIE
jgi:GxxExxY protein